MKNYVLTFIMLLGMTIPHLAHAQPHISVEDAKPDTLELEVKKDKNKPASYSPIWIVEEGATYEIKKFIWVPLENGENLIVVANNSALLRLAWQSNTYGYEHQTQTTTN